MYNMDLKLVSLAEEISEFHLRQNEMILNCFLTGEFIPCFCEDKYGNLCYQKEDGEVIHFEHNTDRLNGWTI